MTANTSIVPQTGDGLQPSVFNFHEFKFRTFSISGESWFAATDACEALGIVNTSDAVSRLDDDEKTTIVLTDSGRPMKLILVNEPGLYALIHSSRKPEAKLFKRWVNHEVLPELRKTGVYAIKELTPAQALLVAVQQLVDHEQRTAALEANVQGNRQNYFTIQGYANYIHVRNLSESDANKLGRAASKLSKDQNYDIEKVPHPKHGFIGSYHIDILKQVFGR